MTAFFPATAVGGEATAGAIEIVLVLLLAATGLAVLARRIGIPYPILLVLGGLAIGFVPGLPPLELEPDLVFLLFLPPILFAAGYFTSIRDFKANLRPIGLLAVGLVLFTMVAVAVVAYTLIPGLGWPAAFALGAIVAPPDAVAASAILQRLGAPRRLVVILEGESLVNDATALVAYRVALLAVTYGTVSLIEAGGLFVYAVAGGVAVGLLVGVVAARLISRIDDPVFSVVVTFLAPIAAYLPAEKFGMSGVIATVTAGILVGRLAPRALSSEVRIAATAAWQVLLFLINSMVFILIGLQLPTVLDGLAGYTPGQLAGLAAAVSLTVVVARIVWVFPATWLPRRLSASLRARDPMPPARIVFLLSWAGMRGVVSLAAALALPITFPERNLLIFLTFVVILVTLVGQGLSLPLVIRRLGIVADGGTAQEESEARMAVADAAVARIDELTERWGDHQELLDALRTQYSHWATHHVPEEAVRDEAEQELLDHRQIRAELVEAEREALIRLLETGAIREEVFRRVERDLDLEELRMED